MQVTLICTVVLLGACTGSSIDQGVTPIQKVIQMLGDMAAKGKKAMEEEAAMQAEYATFCKDTAWEKTTSIKTAKASIEELTADIGKADADVMVAAKEIAALTADISSWTASVKTGTREREEASATFAEVHKDYTDSIDAVARAISVLKSSPGQSFAQESLLQLSSLGRISAKDKKRIMAFLQKGVTNALIQDAMDMDQPQAKVVAYESSSGGVIEMVEKLGEKFEEEKAALEQKEATDKHSFDMMMQDLNQQITYGTEEKDSKVALKAKREGDKADAEGEMEDTKVTMAEDEKFLSDLIAECEAKAMEVEQNQKTRQEELDAIAKAIEIMSSDEVSGSGDKHLPGLIQTSSYVQLRSTAQSSAQQAVAIFLEDKAERTGSRILALLADKVQADPFKKIVKMIKDMITKLTEEANEEAEHKGFCDSELGANKQTRDTKTEESEMLKATIEELSADIAKLAQEITDLSNQITELDSAIKKATDMRTAEKEKNTATIADAAAGKEAVGKAMSVLKAFYDKAATATALTQIKTGAPYTGMGGGGILGMLEVCESDFARLESETTTGEAEAAKEYESFMGDSSEAKATKEDAVKHKSGTKQSKESALATAKKDLAGVSDELTAALAYYEKLKPSCVDAGESYEERVARRKEEIESLQEALKILNGESI